MKKQASILILMLAAATSFAATPAAPAVSTTGKAGETVTLQAPGGNTAPSTTGVEAAAVVTATCKDGTTFSGTTKKGACSGHKGVKSWASADMTPNPMTTKSDSAKTAAQKSSAPLSTAAAGGGAGKVWVNEKSNTYHCQTDRFYGKTKTGAYMTEAEAKAKGAHADHGKACA